ncbi:MAG: type II secretion system F family protein [Erysipelotrichia bacterium]|nr:type II secretion system F family protein [Erysipelotrichia bacterium]
MATYKYIAKDMNAKKVTGKMEARSRSELVDFLRKKDMFLIQCKELSDKEKTMYTFKLNELAEFNRQLSTMLGSGISLIRAMSILVKRDNKVKIKNTYKNIYVKLQQGFPLSVALQEQGNSFPLLMINMIRSGEESGQLELTTKKLAVQYEKDYRMKNKLRNAMIYPVVLLVITVVVVFLIFTLILPTFFEYFEGGDMPAITQGVLALSHFMSDYWYIVLIVILSVIALWLILLREDKVRLWYDKTKLRMPIFAKLLRTVYTARFARTLSSLYSSGVSMINALLLTKDTINNTYIANQFDEVVKLIRDGTTLSIAIQKIDGFDAKLYSSIFIGEESGKLDEMLESIADDFDYEAEIASQRMVTILEPVMIVILALIVGIVMISVMLPLYTMYSSIGA